jgi:hypothetical protein
MQDEQTQPVPDREALTVALEVMIGPRLAQPELAQAKVLAMAKPLLTLECVGGPPVPVAHERGNRLQTVRELLKDVVQRFFEIPASEFPKKFKVDSDGTREEEAAKLVDAVATIFQLNSLKPDPRIEIRVLRSDAAAIWGKGDRWFERQREEFVIKKLAEWIIEYEEAYRLTNSPLENPRDLLEEKPSADSTGDQDRLPDLDEEQLAIAPPGIEPGRRWWLSRLTGSAFVAALVIGAAVAILASSGGSDGSRNAAGKISRVLTVSAPEDLAAAGGFVWLVDANDETAIRVSEANGKRETIFVDQPPFVSGPLPGSHTHTGTQVGGYRIAAGPNGAWIVTNGGVVLAIGTTGRKVRTLNPHIRILAGEPVLYRGSLWVAGFGEYLYRLRARDGVIQRKYELLTDPFVIDNLAAGVGSIWAYNDSSGSDPKINILTPVSGRRGVEESVLPLDRPANDLAAGLGAVWTLNADRTVTRYDPATGGSSRPIQVPGGAQALALSQDAVWIGTGNDTAVRIDPTTLAMIGEPIKLPGEPIAIGADENVWVATPTKLVEIEF